MFKYVVHCILLIFIIFLNFCVDVNKAQNGIIKVFVFPNPFNSTIEDVIYKISLKKDLNNDKISLSLLNENGSVIWFYQNKFSGNNIEIAWNGENNSGITIAPGIYRVKVQVKGSLTGEKIISIVVI